MEVNYINEILDLYVRKQWKQILEIRKKLDYSEARKLLWVWPSESNLYFIYKTILKFKLNGLISLGCGCGLLEWILHQSTGLPVIGYEVNEEWWKSKYSSPQFIELQFPKLPPTKQIFKPDYALMFCYFNNGDAFKQYINSYDGQLVFIIGPGEGSGRHTNPDPFKPDFGSSRWILYGYEEVEDTLDFIAVYVKK